MTATPGQAAREAFGELGADWYPGTPWNRLHEDLRAQWEAAAQAAVDAATEGSLRACGYTLADVGRFLEAEAAAQEPHAALPAAELEAAAAAILTAQNANDGEPERFETNLLAKVALTAAHRVRVAAREPHAADDSYPCTVCEEIGGPHGVPWPARADEFARVKVRLSALIASMEDTVRPRPDDLYDSMSREFDDGAVHATAVTLRQLRVILDDTALGTTPKPAPGLAAAMRETRLIRERVTAVAEGLEQRAAVNHPSKVSQICTGIAASLRRALEGK